MPHPRGLPADRYPHRGGRALSWERVHLTTVGAMPACIDVWRSVRSGGDTKTRKSQRIPALPPQAVDALRAHRVRQAAERLAGGQSWAETGLVFSTQVGTALDAANVRRAFRAATEKAGLEADSTPRGCGTASSPYSQPAA